MPYDKLTDLPDRVRSNLPKHAQEIYKEAFNSAEEPRPPGSLERGGE
jgi:cation transport regulator